MSSSVSSLLLITMIVSAILPSANSQAFDFDLDDIGDGKFESNFGNGTEFDEKKFDSAFGESSDFGGENIESTFGKASDIGREFDYDSLMNILKTDVDKWHNQGLKCWTCTNAASNSDCLTNGEIISCDKNKVCENEVGLTNGVLIMNKRCQLPAECTKKNINSAPFWQLQCNVKTMFPAGMECQCCCSDDYCNDGPLWCNPPK